MYLENRIEGVEWRSACVAEKLFSSYSASGFLKFKAHA